MENDHASSNALLLKSLPLLAGLLLVGCGRDEIRSYRVEKEAPQISVAGAKPHLHFDTPQGWREVDPGSMRVASFQVHGENEGHAEVSVIPLPGAADIELESVNMWRSELGLPPVQAGELKGEPVKIGEGEGEMFEMASESAEAPRQGRTVGAIMKGEEATWFFKMTGDKELVAAQKEAFRGFLASVDIHSEAHGADPHAGMASSQPVFREDHDSELSIPQWDVPQNWQRKAPGPMVLAAFSASRPSGPAEVTISVFPGDTGGLLANANRWRGQVGLPPVQANELQAQEIGEGAGKVTVVDYTGDRNGQSLRLVAAIATNAGNSWFYKIMGSPETIEAEKENFIKFVRSAKYPNAG